MEVPWMTAKKSNNEEETFSKMISPNYTSCIVFKGKPILSPVMTPLVRSEMKHYKEMAVRIEKLKVKRSSEQKMDHSSVKIDIDCDRNIVDESDNSRLIKSCTPSFASTDLAKYMNINNENEESSLWDDVSQDEELVINAPTNLDISVTKTADNEEIQNNYDSGTSSPLTPLTVAENIVEETECVSPIRRGSYTLDQPSPALVAYFKGLNLEAEISDNQAIEINESTPLNNNNNNNNTSFESLGTDSVFANLFALRQKDFGIDESIMNNNYKNSLDELIKKHDEALETLKQSFFQAASNLVHQIKVSRAENSQHNQPITSTNSSPFSDLHIPNTEDKPSTLPYKSYVVVSKQNEKHRNVPNFDRVSAVVKGYLTRRLFRTVKVQTIVKTIKDTLEFAFELHADSPLNNECVTPQDAELHERLIAQLSSACYEIHDIFFKITTKERMMIIAQDRALLQEKHLREMSLSKPPEGQQKHRKVSSATVKALDRRRRRIDSRNSASPRAGRIIKSKVPRDSPTFNKRYRRNLESELRAYSASPQLPKSSYIYTEQRPRSSVSEILSTKPSFQRSLDYKQPIIRKVKTKQQMIQRSFIT